jgi:5-methylcytosine-specific restriction endonuclease McrA
MSVRFLWEEQGGRCWYCTRPVRSREATVDHVLAKSRGGTNEWANVVMACRQCNERKANRTTRRLKTLARLNALRVLSGLDPMATNDISCRSETRRHP